MIDSGILCEYQNRAYLYLHALYVMTQVYIGSASRSNIIVLKAIHRNIVFLQTRRTCLHFAAADGSVEVLHTLIAYNADVHIKDWVIHCLTLVCYSQPGPRQHVFVECSMLASVTVLLLHAVCHWLSQYTILYLE